MGNCTGKIKLEEINKSRIPIAQLLVKYYVEYDKMSKSDKVEYDKLIVSFLNDLVKDEPIAKQ